MVLEEHTEKCIGRTQAVYIRIEEGTCVECGRRVVEPIPAETHRQIPPGRVPSLEKRVDRIEAYLQAFPIRVHEPDCISLHDCKKDHPESDVHHPPRPCNCWMKDEIPSPPHHTPAGTQPPLTVTELQTRLANADAYASRLRALLEDWISAAQSGGHRFGRVLQEPRPERLREAIAQAVALDENRLAMHIRAQAWRHATARCRGLLAHLLRPSDDLLHKVGVSRQEIQDVLFETAGDGRSEHEDLPRKPE